MFKTFWERIKPIYKKYAEFITKITPLKEEEQFFKFIIYFADNTSLRVTEYWKENTLFRYSYYYLDDKNNLIAGWDNAPHHKKVITFPHHKHHNQQILPAKEKTLEEVLANIFSNSI